MNTDQSLRAGEQDRLKFIFDSLPIGICLHKVHADGRVERNINDAHLRICGITREQEKDPAIWRRLTPPEDLARQDALGAKVRSGEINQFSIDKRYVRPDGKTVWVIFSYQRRRLDDGGYEDLTTVVDITDRKGTEAELTYERDLLRALMDNSPDHIYFKDRQSRFLKCGKAHAINFGVSTPEELVGKTDFDFFSAAHAQPAFEDEQAIIRTGQPVIGKVEKEVWRDGRESWVLTSKMPLRDQAGEIIGTFGISKDITNLKRAEAQLLQSQKMETVGKLAGGVAHEFNSLLTVIIGQCEMMRLDLTSHDPFQENVAEILQSAKRAATLTRQLLAYSRRQILHSEVLDLNRIVQDMANVLRPMLGGSVEVAVVTSPGPQTIRADAGQIQQVIVNLAMNAHDAMPHGGTFTLATAPVTITPDLTPDAELKPGPYVLLTVTDSGTGMSDKIKARLFEPFFTTKDVGKGTGLGLPTCYGIIKQSGGHITVQSELGCGTTFKIYLPQASSATAPAPPRADLPLNLPNGTETILLVEDDRSLAEMLTTLLERLGYTVMTAASGMEALNLARNGDLKHLDLLLTDIVMPHMNGRQLAEQFRALHPRIKVLFCSAYADDPAITQGIPNGSVAVLKKPFTPVALASTLRQALDE